MTKNIHERNCLLYDSIDKTDILKNLEIGDQLLIRGFFDNKKYIKIGTHTHGIDK